MSKFRSGLFPNTSSNAKMLIKATHTAVQMMISQTPGGNKKSMAVGAYDHRTGQIATAFAGKIA